MGVSQFRRHQVLGIAALTAGVAWSAAVMAAEAGKSQSVLQPLLVAPAPSVPPSPQAGTPQPSTQPLSRPLAPHGKLGEIDVEIPASRRNLQPPMRFAGRGGAGLDVGAKSQRQREGAKLIDRRGRFEVHGDQVLFFARDPEARFIALENLALERVVDVMEESGSQLEWSVSGELTEFRSSNYLLLSRAMIKSIPGKEVPRPLAEPMTTGAPLPTPRMPATVPATASRPGDLR